MANLVGLSIDPDVKESSGAFVVLPKGTYKMVITGDELKETQKGGKMLVLDLQVVDGEYAGTGIIDRLNIINASEVAQKIGQGTLKKICSVCSVPFPPKDTAKLYGKPMNVTVDVTEFESNKEAGKMLQSNEVKKYEKFVKKEAEGAW